MAVNDVWHGALTTTGFKAVARFTGNTARVVVSTSPTFDASPRYSATTPFDANGLARMVIGGLSPATEYHWGVEVDGVLDTAKLGTVRTLPADYGSFTFWSSSCAATGSNHQVFSDILNADCTFGLHLGDLHYEDVAVSDPSLFHTAFNAALGATAQSALYRNCPTVYMWDDHDYGPNNSDYTSPSRVAAYEAYKDRVPAYPTPSADVVHHTFVAGRVRFVILDARSWSGQTAGSILGANQQAWLSATLTAATEPLIIVTTGVPWLGTDTDCWGEGVTQSHRLAVAQEMVAAGAQGRLVLVAGDQHGIAYDDGTHNTVAGLGAPVVQGAALDQVPSDKGGTYTVPTSPGGWRWAHFSVTDTGGDTVSLTITGWADGAVYFTDTLTFAATPVEPSVSVRLDGQTCTVRSARLDGRTHPVRAVRLVP